MSRKVDSEIHNSFWRLDNKRKSLRRLLIESHGPGSACYRKRRPIRRSFHTRALKKIRPIMGLHFSALDITLSDTDDFWAEKFIIRMGHARQPSSAPALVDANHSAKHMWQRVDKICRWPIRGEKESENSFQDCSIPTISFFHNVIEWTDSAQVFFDFVYFRRIEKISLFHKG